MSNKRRISVKYDSSTTDEEEMSDENPRRSYRETAGRKQDSATVDENIIAEPRRRVRGPSKRPCLNRNALMARENRQRKKEYVQKIENKLSFYQQENKNLANTIQKQGIDIKRLTGEVAYLKSVLHNNTAITALLRSINDGLWKRCSCFTNEVKMQGLVNNQLKLKTEDPMAFGYNENSVKSNDLKLPIAKKTAYPFSDTDHTYTTSKLISSTNVETQQNSKEIKRLNGVNEMHFYHMNGNDYVDSKRTQNAKSILNAAKVLDARSIINNVNVLGDVFDEETMSTNVQKIMTDKNVMDSRVTSKEPVLDNVTDKSLFNQKNTVDNKAVVDADNHTPIIQSSSNSDTTKGNIMVQSSLDQLPLFNMDIFEDLPKCDDFVNSIDELEEDPGLFNEGNLLQNLNNTGICLHVNSDKVSLEFCSVCHLNSTNSEMD